MKPKVSVYIATSLDGFIAREDGNLDWLDAAGATVPEGEDCGYHALMETVDLLVLGRKTFEKVLSLGDWPYGKQKVLILSSRPHPLLADLPDSVSHSSEDPETLCSRVAKEGVQHIYIDGGVTIQKFLAADLVDEMTITVIPTLLGGGIPLFGGLQNDIALSVLEVKPYDFGFVQLKYQVQRNAAP